MPGELPVIDTEKHTVIGEHEKEKGEASQRFIKGVERIVPDLEAMERTLDAARETTGDLAEKIKEVARQELVKLRDSYEDITQADIPQELRDKYEAINEAVARKFMELMVRTSVEEYENRVKRIIDDMLQVDVMLELQGESAKVRDEMRTQLERLTDELRVLDKQAGHVASSVRKKADTITQKAWEHIHRLASGGGQEKKKEQKKEVVHAWMPRVPSPPYRATLAAMQMPTGGALPDLPEHFDDLDDTAKVNVLEEFLKAFRAEHERIIGEHQAVMKRLTEQIKERKLQALRESLN